MTRITLALLLALAAANVGAVNLPWQDATPNEAPQYCKGFVVGGLASNRVSGMSRTELWLAWNYLIRSGLLEQSASEDEFQTGLQQLRDVLDAAAADAVLRSAGRDCGLGRTGHQVTGW